MTNKRKSKQNGALKSATTEHLPGMPSSGAGSIRKRGSQIISDMSDTIVPQKPNFQPMATWQGNANATNANLVQAFAARLGALVEWRRVELADGREGYALFFPDDNWQVLDEKLLPR